MPMEDAHSTSGLPEDWHALRAARFRRGCRITATMGVVKLETWEIAAALYDS
jgi:hypothetical protein